MTSLPSEDQSLVPSLREVHDKPGFGAHLTLLHIRAGKPKLETLARAAFRGEPHPSTKKSTVRNWLKGINAPSTWESLHEVLKVLGATEDETSEFRSAYERLERQRSDARSRALANLRKKKTAEENEAAGENPLPGVAVPVVSEGPAAAAPEPKKASEHSDASNRAPRKTGRRRSRYALIAVGAVVLVLGVGTALTLSDGLGRPSHAGGDNGKADEKGAGKDMTSPSPESHEATPTLNPVRRSSGSPSARPSVAAPHASTSATIPPPGRTTSPSRPSGTAPLPAFGTITQMVSVESGLCVDGGVQGNDSDIYQWDCAEGAVNQQWQLGHTGGEIYQVMNYYSDKCLGITQTPERLDVVQMTCAAQPAQQWRFKAANTEMYGGEWISGYLINSRYGKCLTLSQASHEQHADIGEWDCAEGTRHQMFRVRPGAL